MRCSWVLALLFAAHLQVKGGPEKLVLPTDFELAGSQGTQIQPSQVQGKGLLLVFFNEKSGRDLGQFWYLGDFETQQFKVIPVDVSPPSASRRASEKETLPFETFQISRGVLPVSDTLPGYRFFGTDGVCIASDEGFPDRDLLFKWSLAAVDPEKWGEVGYILGQKGAMMQRHKNDCGVAATLMLIAREGFALAEQEVYSNLDPGPMGAQLSLLQIQRFLKQYGIPGSGWRGSLADLKKATHPLILHLDEGHFVVQVGFWDKGVLLIDPKLGRQWLSQAAFLKRWKGIYFRIDNPK